MPSMQTHGIWPWWPAEVNLPSPMFPGRNYQTGRLPAATSYLIPASWPHWRCSGSQEIHLTQSKISSFQRVISCLCVCPSASATTCLGNNCVAALPLWGAQAEPTSHVMEDAEYRKWLNVCLASQAACLAAWRKSRLVGLELSSFIFWSLN